MLQLKYLNVALLALSSLSMSSSFAVTLKAMTDEQLSNITGQALMSLTYIAPTDSQNLETNRVNGAKNIGFYKLGMEAELELNANIKKLQLGCGGVNGANGCDIDIDYLSLSGVTAEGGQRASTSAKLTNPFLEFAIKNPNSASTREVVGMRASSEAIQGMLTFGLENGINKSGINSLSGYMEVAKTSGTAKVAPVLGLKPSDVDNAQISGIAQGWTSIDSVGFVTKNYNLNLTADAAGKSNENLTGLLELPQQVITGKRINNTILKASASVSGIYLTGTIEAVAAKILNLNKTVNGVINNLKVDVTIDENLGYFHKANLNGSAASLSLQSQDIQWTGAKSVASNGWWLELSNPIDIGKIDPTNPVQIASSTIKDTLGEVSNYLTNVQPVKCGWAGLLSCVGGSSLSVGNVNLINASSVPMTLKNIELLNQGFSPNCYGNLKFC